MYNHYQVFVVVVVPLCLIGDCSFAEFEFRMNLEISLYIKVVGVSLNLRWNGHKYWCMSRHLLPL